MRSKQIKREKQIQTHTASDKKWAAMPSLQLQLSILIAWSWTQVALQKGAVVHGQRTQTAGTRRQDNAMQAAVGVYTHTLVRHPPPPIGSCLFATGDAASPIVTAHAYSSCISVRPRHPPRNSLVSIGEAMTRCQSQSTNQQTNQINILRKRPVRPTRCYTPANKC